MQRGGDCGGCPGFCAGISFHRASSLTEQNIADCDAFVELITDASNGILTVIPDGNMDNGDGYVRVEDDASVDSELARDLGFESIRILKGTYAIFRDANAPYGYARFRAEYFE